MVIPIFNDINKGKYPDWLDFQVNILKDNQESWDYVIVSLMDVPLLERLMTLFPAKVIPLMSTSSLWRQIPLSLIATNASPFIKKAYYSFLSSHVQEFPYILFGNAGMELNRGDVSLIQQVEKKYEQVSSKFIYAPFDSYLEAAYFDNSPLLQLGREKPLLSFCGFTYLYPTAYSLHQMGYMTLQQWEKQSVGYTVPFFIDSLRSQARAFPFDYVQERLKALNVWCGLGLDIGLRNTHKQRLFDFGYKGILFYLPNSSKEWERYKRIFEEKEGILNPT